MQRASYLEILKYSFLKSKILKYLSSGVALLSITVLACAVVAAHPSDVFAQETIKIGGLILVDPNEFNDLGREKVIDYVVDKFNADQAALGGKYVVEYTQIPIAFNVGGLSHAEQDLYQKVRNAYHGGIKYFVGPSASSSAATAKAFADTTNDAILISPSSTAPSLALPRDSLFRLVHDDEAQAPEVARLLERDGKDHIVIVQRDDLWGQGLYNAISNVYPGSSALVTLQPSDSVTSDSYYNEVAADIRDEVSRLSAVHGPSSVAVVLVTFHGDAINLVQAVLDDGLDNVLGAVNWYGTDGVAGNTVMLENLVVSEFLSSVRFTATIFEAEDNAVSMELADHLNQYSGLDFSYRNSVYDATYLLLDSVIAEIELAREDVVARDLVRLVANNELGHSSHSPDRTPGEGALGSYSLNGAGDLYEPRTYAALQVVDASGGSFEWRDSMPSRCR